MGRRKAERFVTEAERRERLKLQAEAAAASFRRTGRVPKVYDTPEVTGAMIARGLASVEELRAAHARLGAGLAKLGGAA